MRRRRFGRHTRGLAVAGIAVFVATGCARHTLPDAHAAPHDGAAHWSYSGATGPAFWHTLGPDYATCALGTQQSPIDLAGVSRAAQPPISVESGVRSATVADNGHTLQADLSDGGMLHRGSDAYRMLQFHYHRPSEHTVNGSPAAAEIHFVHRAADGRLAVVGLLLDEGAAASEAVDVLLRAAAPGPGAGVNAAFDPSRMLPADLSYRAYSGSLTTPPCTEGVQWLVLDTRGSVSRAQLQQLDRMFTPNARPAVRRAPTPAPSRSIDTGAVR